MIRHVAMGIDRYDVPGNDLGQCVADARDMVAAIGADRLCLVTDQEAVRARCIDAIGDMVASARCGDWVVISWSGHGTYVPDKDGDEADGRDEALCCYNLSDGRAGLLVDDDLQLALNEAGAGVTVMMIADTCHSGTVARAMLRRPHSAVRRFLHPASFMGDGSSWWDRLGWFAELEHLWHGPPKPMAAKKRIIHMAACRDDEYAYEGADGGYFTMAWIRAKRSMVQTVGELHRQICVDLPSPDAPQHPQLHADEIGLRLPWV